MKEVVLLITIFFLFPKSINAQEIVNTRPLPILKGIKKVVVTKVTIDTSGPQFPYYSTKPKKIYSYNLDMSGRVTSSIEYGYWEYWESNFIYDTESRVIKKEVKQFNTNKDSLIQHSKFEYFYEGDNLTGYYYFNNISTNIKDRILRYNYDKLGKIISSTEITPLTEFSKNFMNRIDSSVFIFKNDSLYFTEYKMSEPHYNRTEYYKMNDKNQLIKRTMFFEGKVYFNIDNRYNKQGQLINSSNQSDRPIVQPDGLVLRYDLFEYKYDKNHKLIEELHFAEKILREKEIYTYEFYK